MKYCPKTGITIHLPIRNFVGSQKLKHLAQDLNDVVKLEKKDLLGRIDNQGNELKRKIELETNEIR
jgi:hypothetical protein